MTQLILMASALLLSCVFAEKASNRFGMPALIFFMFIGMLAGSDGILKLPFSNFTMAENICSAALIIIMFYGGFNTKWKHARPVAAKAVALSTAGVVLTALLTALLCWKLLGFSLTNSFLIGAVLSSTDAASVFAILRKNNLDLRDGTASILEVESGSNDPMAYLLTIIGVSGLSAGRAAGMVVIQIVVGLAAGVVFAFGVSWAMNRSRLVSESLDAVFLAAAVLLCYSISDTLGGNAYLSVYIMGILVGNRPLRNKGTLIPFFDGMTSLAQILIFFLLGLLTFPHQMPSMLSTALAIVACITLIARPVAVFVLLVPFKCSVRQCLLISWAGLRGASSSVFAIMAVARGAAMQEDLFHIVFLVSLFSVAIQGTLLPQVARRLDMVDDAGDVRRTFNDYEESGFALIKTKVSEGHFWASHRIRELAMPTGALALMIKRGDQTIVPRGDTEVEAGDKVIWIAPRYTPKPDEKLEEVHIEKWHPWCGKRIVDLALPPDILIAMVLRGAETIIPDGQTLLQEDDRVVTFE
ncbi:MAG: potassium/proton antiporter [Faecalibacterium sp.]